MKNVKNILVTNVTKFQIFHGVKKLLCYANFIMQADANFIPLFAAFLSFCWMLIKKNCHKGIFKSFLNMNFFNFNNDIIEFSKKLIKFN